MTSRTRPSRGLSPSWCSSVLLRVLSSKSPMKPTSSSRTRSRTVRPHRTIAGFNTRVSCQTPFIDPDVARSLSVPNMQFEKSSYTAKEKDNLLHIPIIRTGDLSFKSSVRCFTRTMSAMVMDDFEERRNADESRITFLKGEKVKC